MKKALMYIAATALAVSVGAAHAADKKTLAIVVKGLDNAFFTSMGNGCAKWNEEHADSPYTCVYTGPALTSDEAGEIQLVSDLIARDDVAGIAISPSNAPAMATTTSMPRWWQMLARPAGSGESVTNVWICDRCAMRTGALRRNLVESATSSVVRALAMIAWATCTSR